MFLWTATLGCLAHNTLVTADAHSSLSVPSQSIVPSEYIATKTFIWFVSSVNLGVTLQVMSTNEALVAMITLILAITKVGLDVGLDIFFSSEPPLAAGVKANPLSILRVRARDVGGDLIDGDPSLFDRSMNPSIKVKAIN